jgi:hypothetical protein
MQCGSVRLLVLFGEIAPVAAAVACEQLGDVDRIAVGDLECARNSNGAVEFEPRAGVCS